MPISTAQDGLAAEFAAHRSHLIGVAYRLTGTRADAEDAVQESWLRLAGLDEAGQSAIRDLRGWLTTVVGRICLDRLKSAPARRERYVGQWLPEPVVTPFGQPVSDDPLEAAVRDDGVRMAAMIVLDKLGPEQRVAFVLHDAFSVPFAEIGEILGCSADAARQHGSRGRRAVADADPPPRVALDEQRQLLEKFVAALLEGDLRAITELLHPDAVLIGDSDGKGRTARQRVEGPDKLARFLLGLMRKYERSTITSGAPVLVNGDFGMYLPPQKGAEGFLSMDEHVQAMAVRDGRIVAIYDVVNPDKLARITRPGGEP